MVPLASVLVVALVWSGAVPGIDVRPSSGVDAVQALLIGGAPVERPTPRPAPPRLAPPPPVAPASAGGADAVGAYEFMALQPHGDEPVTYDPCRPIPVVVNDEAAPPRADILVASALDQVSEVTGLRFELEGATEEVPTEERSAYQPERYGDRWAPVLVAWSDPVASPWLVGDIAGVGGSTSVVVEDAGEVYVSGMVALDGPQLGGILRSPKGWAQARSVVLHELAHVVGLAHVDDPTQLMNADGHVDVTTFQAGDLAGLAHLGAGPCIPEL